MGRSIEHPDETQAHPVPLSISHDDPLSTPAQMLAFGYNARGRVEVSALQTLLQYRYPAAFAAFGKQCRADRIHAGMLWVWREAQPYLGFMVVRESPVGPTRLRHVQQIALTLARDYRLEGLRSVAIAGLCSTDELPPLQAVLSEWFAASALEVTLYW